jgi:hypothetical protein
MDINSTIRPINTIVHRTGSHITASDVSSWERAGGRHGICAHCKGWRRLGLDTCYIKEGVELKVCYA